MRARHCHTTTTTATTATTAAAATVAEQLHMRLRETIVMTFNYACVTLAALESKPFTVVPDECEFCAHILAVCFIKIPVVRDPALRHSPLRHSAR